ncbi:MAG: helix-turn-helix domain-containing protein [Deltaproteobacteria bacterium]|nr:helix-turn-helix domain-containing protein [Deltaproteobacteria bacterium]
MIEVATPTSASNKRTVVDPKMSLSLWLRAGRANKGLSLLDVAKITKIQSRILERLEAGKLDGLPAEVFVRGFVRSYARCCGLDETETLARYSLAAGAPTAPTAAARALVDSMSELAPITATRAPKLLGDVELAAGSIQDLPRATQEIVVETFLPETVEAAPSVTSVVEPAIEAIVEPIVEPIVAEPIVAAPSTKSKKGKKSRGKKRKEIASGTPSAPLPVVSIDASAAPSVLEPIIAEGSTATPATIEHADVIATDLISAEPIEPVETWSPKMPPTMPSVPWRRPVSTLMSKAPSVIVPTIVIDDADPDSAEREIEDRVAAKEPTRRSFLPPILLDREDRSARQGGLTLAVIILLIAATLTLSYLMRRPSSTGDGVTLNVDETSQIVA